MQKFIILLITLNYSCLIYAGNNNSPWFTGPLFAGSGTVICPTCRNIQFYQFYIEDKSSPITTTWKSGLFLQSGIVKNLEIAFYLPYLNINQANRRGRGFGDLNAIIAYHFLKHEPSHLDMTLKIGQIFPTGKYHNLNEQIEATGKGAYKTRIQLNIQKSFTAYNLHTIKTRFNLAYTFSSNVNLNGVNFKSESPGSLESGSTIFSILSFEYSLTQRWAPVLELLYSYNAKATFNDKEEPSTYVLSIAPEIEYSFNSRFGIIGGIWFNIQDNVEDNFFSGIVSAVYAF